MTEGIVHSDEAAFLRYLAYLLELRAAGGRWPSPVFEQLLKLMAHTSWEFIPWRIFSGTMQLLYSRRGLDDLAYPPDPIKGSPWCFAGTHNRGESLETGLARVNREHYRFPAGQISHPKFIGCINWYREERGAGLGVVFLCSYAGETPPDTQWFDIDHPPDHMVEGHRMMAARVQEALREMKLTPWFLDDSR